MNFFPSLATRQWLQGINWNGPGPRRSNGASTSGTAGTSGITQEAIEEGPPPDPLRNYGLTLDLDGWRGFPTWEMIESIYSPMPQVVLFTKDCMGSINGDKANPAISTQHYHVTEYPRLLYIQKATSKEPPVFNCFGKALCTAINEVILLKASASNIALKAET